MEIMFGGWCVSLLIGGLLGKYIKDRPGAGVLLAAFLGPLGWLLVLAIEDNMRKCPQCQERVAKEASVCRYCRLSLPPTLLPVKYSPLTQLFRGIFLVFLFITLADVAASSAMTNSSDWDILRGAVVGIPISLIFLGISMALASRDKRKHELTLNLETVTIQTESPIELRCPSCRAKLQVKPKLRGLKIQCPGCKNAITVSV